MKRIPLLFALCFLTMPVVALPGTVAPEPRRVSAAEDSSAYFTNPITVLGCADPTIWNDGGVWYMMSTGVRQVFTSTDMVDWTPTGKPVLTRESFRKAKQAGNHFWAPDVAKVGDKWMMYLSLYNSADDTGIGVFESDSPSGPWEYCGLLTHSHITGIFDTIDPELVFDPATGKLWFFFGSVGKIHRVELDGSGKSLAEGASYKHVAGLSREVDPGRMQVFEGVYLHKREDWWYMFVSGGRYSNHTYHIRVGRSRTLDGEFVGKDGKSLAEGGGTVVISSRKGDALYGPGHNGEIFTDDNGQDYIFYHCHDLHTPDPGNRQLMLQRIFWTKDGWPYVVDGVPARKELRPYFLP